MHNQCMQTDLAARAAPDVALRAAKRLMPPLELINLHKGVKS
jgi:hypothetical protein